VSEGYQAKKKRWLKLAAGLPPEVSRRIALRNVEAASLLKPEAQQTLARALDEGLRRVSAAIRILRQRPDASVEDLLREECAPAATQARVDRPARRGKQPGTALSLAPGSGSPVVSSLARSVELPLEGLAGGDATPASPESPPPAPPLPGPEIPSGAAALAGLIRACFPSMPRISAEALAATGLTTPLRELLLAWQECLFSPQLTDLTFVILAGFVQQAQAELQEKVAAKPAYCHALHNSGVSLPDPERRN